MESPPNQSYAALNAIKAMQRQLKSLEAENFELKREKKRLLKLNAEKSQELTDRRQRLMEKTENAKQMLKAASVAYSQISNVRSEVESLKQKNQFAEDLLNKERKKGQDIEEQLISLKSDLSTNTQKLNAYQAFLGEFLQPPPPPTAIGLNELVVLSSDDANVDSLDQNLIGLYQRISEYPKQFQTQNLEMKKNILRTFCDCQAAVCSITDQIQLSDKQRRNIPTKAMSEETIHLYQQYFVLANEMKQFTFV